MTRGPTDPPGHHEDQTVTDFLGREIHVGDIIVYPGRKGSTLWMNKGRVLILRFGDGSNFQPTDELQVQPLQPEGNHLYGMGRPVTLKVIQNVVVILDEHDAPTRSSRRGR